MWIGGKMQVVGEHELIQIVGGTSISGTLINSFSTILKTISSLGRSFGSSLRRIATNSLCPL